LREPAAAGVQVSSTYPLGWPGEDPEKLQASGSCLKVSRLKFKPGREA
jgi:hypothetical protein